MPLPNLAKTIPGTILHPLGPSAPNYIGGLTQCKGMPRQFICWMVVPERSRSPSCDRPNPVMGLILRAKFTGAVYLGRCSECGRISSLDIPPGGDLFSHSVARAVS